MFWKKKKRISQLEAEKQVAANQYKILLEAKEKLSKEYSLLSTEKNRAENKFNEANQTIEVLRNANEKLTRKNEVLERIEEIKGEKEGTGLENHDNHDVEGLILTLQKRNELINDLDKTILDKDAIIKELKGKNQELSDKDAIQSWAIEKNTKKTARPVKKGNVLLQNPPVPQIVKRPDETFCEAIIKHTKTPRQKAANKQPRAKTGKFTKKKK